MREDFDPDKLIDLMKKNGEWSDEEDGQNPEAEADDIPNMTDEMMSKFNQPDQSEEKQCHKHDQDGDQHMFEQFLKSGEYLHGAPQKKRPRPADLMNPGLIENPEEDDFDEEELAFKAFNDVMASHGNPGKRSKTDNQAEFQDFMKFVNKQK